MECTKNCEEIKKLSKFQDDFIRNMGTIMEQLDLSQLTVEGNAFDAINSSDTSLNLVKEGIECIDELIKQITLLHQVVENSRENMDKLNQLSTMVLGFANVIGGISNRTNTLSLNASIEAAKALEDGKGFANVANEIRELAIKSSQSSSEITETIQVIQMFITETVEGFTKVNEIVEEQNAMIGDVKNVLQKVLEAAYISNDVSRNMEHEIAYQRDITDNARNAIDSVIEMVNES